MVYRADGLVFVLDGHSVCIKHSLEHFRILDIEVRNILSSANLVTTFIIEFISPYLLYVVRDDSELHASDNVYSLRSLLILSSDQTFDLT